MAVGRVFHGGFINIGPTELNTQTKLFSQKLKVGQQRSATVNDSGQGLSWQNFGHNWYFSHTHQVQITKSKKKICNL